MGSDRGFAKSDAALIEFMKELRGIRGERPIADEELSTAKDALTQRLKPRFAQWRSLVGLTDEAAATTIRNDGVHILFDMAGHTDLVRWVGFSPDGKILASTCFDGSIRWTDPSSGRTLRTLKPGTDRQTWGQFSADNRIFVAGSNEGLSRLLTL